MLQTTKSDPRQLMPAVLAPYDLCLQRSSQIMVTLHMNYLTL